MIKFAPITARLNSLKEQEPLIVRTQCHLVARLILAWFLYQAGSPLSGVTAADPPAGSELQQQLQALLAHQREHSADPAFLVHLADISLSLGDDISSETSTRRAHYEEGSRFAQQALALQEQNAQAHYLYAANLGSAARLNGVIASAWTIQALKRHAKRALELNPDHAPALHMMGMMLEELPWVLGGDAEGALTYLRRAVGADPGSVHARLDLARAYVKRKDSVAARKELEFILQQPLSPDASASKRRHREEALQLRDSLRTS